MQKITNIIGKKFGRLTAIKEVERKNSLRRFLCRCDCGQQVTTYLFCLTQGKTKSCGCLRKQRQHAAVVKNLKGLKFGSYTVKQLMPCSNKHSIAMWLCANDNGKDVIFSRQQIMYRIKNKKRGTAE